MRWTPLNCTLKNGWNHAFLAASGWDSALPLQGPEFSPTRHMMWQERKKERKKGNGWDGKSMMYGGGWWFSGSVVSNSCNPMDCSPPGSSVYGILQARILKWFAISFSRGYFWPWDQNPALLHYRQILYWLSYKGSSLSSVMYHFSSVQFSSSVLSDSLRPHGCQASLSITNF